MQNLNGGNEQSNAFETPKDKLTSRPLLAIYDPDRKTEVHTDASKHEVGGILVQYQSDKNIKPFMYFSRQATKEEQRHNSYELETLAVVETLKKCPCLFSGYKF